MCRLYRLEVLQRQLGGEHRLVIPLVEARAHDRFVTVSDAFLAALRPAEQLRGHLLGKREFDAAVAQVQV